MKLHRRPIDFLEGKNYGVVDLKRIWKLWGGDLGREMLVVMASKVGITFVGEEVTVRWPKQVKELTRRSC